LSGGKKGDDPSHTFFARERRFNQVVVLPLWVHVEARLVVNDCDRRLRLLGFLGLGEDDRLHDRPHNLFTAADPSRSFHSGGDIEIAVSELGRGSTRRTRMRIGASDEGPPDLVNRIAIAVIPGVRRPDRRYLPGSDRVRQWVPYRHADQRHACGRWWCARTIFPNFEPFRYWPA
jgi:hypothetical protein